MPGNRLVRFPAYIMKKFIQNSIALAGLLVSGLSLFDDVSISKRNEEIVRNR